MDYQASIRTLCLALIAGAVCCFLGYTAYLMAGAANDLHNTQVVAQSTDAYLTIKAGATLDAINAPMGTLHEVNKAIVKAGDAVVSTQIQEQVATSHLNATLDGIQTIPGHVNTLVDSGSRTLDTATTTLASVSILTSEVGSKVPPLLEAYTQTGDDLDALLKSHAVNDTLTNVDSMTASGAGILANGKTVSDKITYDFMHPVPAWKQPMKILQLGFDAALLAK